MTARFSLRGLLIALSIVALGLPAAFIELFHVFAEISRLNSEIANVREAQLNAGDVSRLQIEQETGVRGYVATHDATFLDSYRSAVTEFPVRASDVAVRLTLGGEETRAASALRDAREINRQWRNDVAQPALDGVRVQIDDPRAKRERDRIRADIDIVSAVLIVAYHRLIGERLAAVHRVSLIGYSALIVVAFQIVVYAFLAERLRGELVRERRVVGRLQRAFTSELVANPHLDVAAAYVSATHGATVGGDVYDIFPIDARTTLIVIADVSGKGVEAAVDSTFVKYSLRAFASEHSDIATVVTKFNLLYGRAQKAPEAFVVLFAGIYDADTQALQYVNAGHEAAYVRRPHTIDQLTPTGPIVGLSIELPFVAATTSVGVHDLLFLSTDGLTEARDPSGTFLTSSGLEVWLRETRDDAPQDVVNTLQRRLRQYTRARSSDDLAILAVRPR